MRPKFITPRNLALILIAAVTFTGLALWGSLGFPLPGQGVPSTAGKLAFVSESGGKSTIRLTGTDGANIAALTPEEETAGEPTFSPNGQQVLFTGERDGIRQLCLMDAAAGRKIVALTRTRSTKQQPHFVGPSRIFYLDGGKISAMGPDASDPLQIFPTAETLNANPYLKAMFKEGGVATAVVSPDGQRAALTINRERGQILVVHERGNGGGHDDNGATVIVGVAERIVPRFLKDGSMVVLFAGGSPLGQPLAIPSPTPSEAEALREQEVALPVPPLPDELIDKTFLVRFDESLKPIGQLPLPVKATEFDMDPSGERAAISGVAVHSAGLIVMTMAAGGDGPAPTMVFDHPCQDIAWSPDGTQIAFSDGADVFVAPADGAAPATNLTNGKQGKATRPAWSPVKPNPAEHKP